MQPAHTVICTVGTSLFRPNLAGLRADDPEPNRQALARAYAAGDWEAVAAGLGTHGPTDRLCGAEINSLASLVAKGYAAADANLVFCISDTADGQAIGRILESYFHRAGHSSVQARTITDLQDRDARLFRTRGLRNLAKEVCKVIRDYGTASCAINATPAMPRPSRAWSIARRSTGLTTSSSRRPGRYFTRPSASGSGRPATRSCRHRSRRSRRSRRTSRTRATCTRSAD